MKENTSPPNPAAFPLTIPTGTHEINEGMTLRDYFAAAAFTGLASNEALMETLIEAVTHLKRQGKKDRDAWAEILAMRAYSAADAMLSERQKAEKGQP